MSVGHVRRSYKMSDRMSDDPTFSMYNFILQIFSNVFPIIIRMTSIQDRRTWAAIAAMCVGMIEKKKKRKWTRKWLT